MRTATGRWRADFLEVFLQVPGDRCAGSEHRQNIHKAEHLDLDRLILHGPFEDLIEPVPAFKHGRASAFQLVPKVASDALRRLFDAL